MVAAPTLNCPTTERLDIQYKNVPTIDESINALIPAPVSQKGEIFYGVLKITTLLPSKSKLPATANKLKGLKVTAC